MRFEMAHKQPVLKCDAERDCQLSVAALRISLRSKRIALAGIERMHLDALECFNVLGESDL